MKKLLLYGCVLLSSAAIANQKHYNAPLTDLNEIVFIEDEDLDLGFDTADYLPKDFDPHKVYVDLMSIPYIEEEKDCVLKFDSAQYLPEGFDAYSDVVGIPSINYIEDDRIDLGFDTSEYLPEGFDPYEAYFSLDWIPYIEDEEELELHLSISILKPRTKLTAK
ncbi:MAG: hypothetical protein AAF969_09940 [Bacteroidota bacterium]